MPDIGDERMAYKEALRRAEERALSGETPQELVTTATLETPSAEPEQEGAVPADAGAATEPTPPVESAPADTSTQEEEPEVMPAVETLEQLRERLAAAEARLEEKDSFIGRQSTEIGELRQAVEQIQQAQAAPPQPAIAITQDMIDENPAQAVQLAWNQQNEQALAVAFDAWKDEDPFAAASWRTDRLLERQALQYQQELAARDQKLETALVPQQAAAEEAAWREAIVSAAETLPGFSAEEAARLLEEVAPQFPDTVARMAQGDMKAKVEGLTLLYAVDKAGKSVPVEEVQDVAREAAESAAAARAAASVAPQSTAGEGAAPQALTPEQEEAKRYVDRIERSQLLDRGWTGRTPGR